MTLPNKRIKLANDVSWSIKAVLADVYEKDIPLVEAYAATVENKQQLSAIMQELAQRLPRLQHLKRVSGNQILICITKELTPTSTLKSHLLGLNLSANIVEALCANVAVVQVPGAAIKLRWQYENMQKFWPSKFHPDKCLESVHDGTNFKQAEAEFHKKMANLLNALALQMDSEMPVGVCVDPRTQSIVAIASSLGNTNPIMHCPLILIDYVARTQKGGAWQPAVEFIKNDLDEKTVLSGIPKRYLDYMKAHTDYKHLRLGAECMKPLVQQKILEIIELSDADNLHKYGPYLCTGYDIYLRFEPCLMCAMALVHSRAKRVFLMHPSQNGALVTQLKLHTVPELNHHYEVYQFDAKS